MFGKNHINHYYTFPLTRGFSKIIFLFLLDDEYSILNRIMHYRLGTIKLETMNNKLLTNLITNLIICDSLLFACF